MLKPPEFKRKVYALSAEEKKRVCPKYDPEKMSNWLTRAEASKVTGLTVAAIIKTEGIRIYPAIDEETGRHYFNPADLEELNARQVLNKKKVETEGDLVARIFSLFRRGTTLEQIVYETRQTPEYIRELYNQYITPLGQVPEDPVAKAKEEKAEYKQENKWLDKEISRFNPRKRGRPSKADLEAREKSAKAIRAAKARALKKPAFVAPLEEDKEAGSIDVEEIFAKFDPIAAEFLKKKLGNQ